MSRRALRLLALGLVAGGVLAAGPAAAQGDPPAPAAPAGAPATQPAPATQEAPVPPGTAAKDQALGIRLLKSGKTEQAATVLARAHAKEPGNAEIANNLGHVLGKLGRRAEAERAYRAAIKADPKGWLAYASLADLWTNDPGRWDRRDQMMEVLAAGLERVGDDAGRVNLTMRLANFEKAIGRPSAARGRLEGLQGTALSTRQRQRVQELLDTVGVEERTRAFEDWPEPPTSARARATLARAEKLLAAGDAAGALVASEPLLQAHPAWRGVRWLRARALEALSRYDEAARELTVLLRLAPSHAEGWRRLGRILVEHGGALEAERADEALRHALALAPSWSELWRLRARAALRRGRPADALRALERVTREAEGRAPDPELNRLLEAARTQARTASAPAAALRPLKEPTSAARALHRDAQEWIAVGDPLEMARDLLQKALDDSPGFIDAAVALYSLTGTVPARTVHAVWDSPEALLELAAKVRALRRDAAGVVRALVRPWIDRAVALGAVEARFERAVIRADEGDAAGALADLTQYLARSVDPAHLDEARALRVALVPALRDDPATRLARIRLLEDRPADALAALGERCEPDVSLERLLAIAGVYEHTGDLRRAARCYRSARLAAPDARAPLERLAAIGVRAPPPLVDELQPDLERAAARGVPAAEWALARSLAAHGRVDDALGRLDRFIATAAPDSPGLDEAQGVRAQILRARSAAAAARRRQLAAAAVVGFAGLGLLLLFLFRGRNVASALRARPALFPDVARAIAEIRHDVIKHRASVLGLLERADAPRDEVARALESPEPTSMVVGDIYARLQKAARGQGVTLRPLGRERVFGPLRRDLRQAEGQVHDPSRNAALLEVDRRLREVHSERLAALLKLGPRTRVDAACLSEWIRDVEAERRGDKGAWTPPAIQLESLEVDFPVERGALCAIFTNLLRNAEAAVRGAAEARVLVRLDDERDSTGRRLLSLQVGDSAAPELRLEDFEARESGRGLAIVRDLVRAWRGHLVVRPAETPLTKVVGACFPA
jgi:tetratricopeptide (TPR) repeat protein